MLKFTYTILSVFLYTVAFGQASEDVLKNYYMNPKAPGGILAIKNDTVLFTSSTGLAHLEKNIPISRETRFRMASVSKQFTAMAVYLLIQDGKLGFETPIKNIFPELTQKTFSVKVKHLLNHSSGLVDYENVIPKEQREQLTDSDVLQLIQDLDTVYFEAGTQFRYSNTAYCLLSLIVERITSQRYEEFCERRIFNRLDMTSTQISAPDTFDDRAFGYKPTQSDFRLADQSITSATRGDGGVYISTLDYAKWMDKNNPLFSPQFFSDLEKYKIAVKDDVYYSLGLFFITLKDGNLTLFHSGESTGFHNIFIFQPKRNYGISLFTNRDDLLIVDIFKEVMERENINIPKNLNKSLFLWLNKVYSNE
jgi:D-alanyl-D-alanine carboxypeptidase